MSASEKLERLGVWEEEGWDARPFDNNQRRRQEELLAALPEIIAVVSTAESCRSDWQMKAELADALTALDEKLRPPT